MGYERLSDMLVARVIPSLQARVVKHGQRFVRFGLVGVVGVLVNTALLYLGAALAHLPAVLAAGLATELTILGNFVLNDRWTFRDVHTRKPRLQRMAVYNSIALGGMLISLGVFVLLMHLLRIHYLLANLGGIAVVTMWNYAVNARITWRTTVTIARSDTSESLALHPAAGTEHSAPNL
jgi:dolichol-phosphate mannosyltransferase